MIFVFEKQRWDAVPRGNKGVDPEPSTAPTELVVDIIVQKMINPDRRSLFAVNVTRFTGDWSQAVDAGSDTMPETRV